MQEHNSESLEYRSNQRMEEEHEHYTPRPKSHIILAWILLGVMAVAILGMCYWQIFGIF